MKHLRECVQFASVTVRKLLSTMALVGMAGCGNKGDASTASPVSGSSGGSGGTQAISEAFSTGGATPATEATATGGSSDTASGGMVASGGFTSTTKSETGGSPPTAGSGGAGHSGGSAGSGCTGSREEVNATTGLCVAKMVSIPSGSAGPGYRIDATEVTQGQYAAWLATKPALPASTDANCGWKATGSYAPAGTGYTGVSAESHPIQYVDWCDAFAYCASFGKRLCGAIGGGESAYSKYADANVNQWYRACSASGVNAYPYGPTYQPTYCATEDHSSKLATIAVGSLSNCTSSTLGYEGVYDLSGNVAEWEDSCDGPGESTNCRSRGGMYSASGVLVSCGGTHVFARRTTAQEIGFRCCSG